MANVITLSRFPLLILVLALLYSRNTVLCWIAPVLLLVLIMMDTLDGFVARARDEVSLLGSILDIAADRAVEIVLWVVLADLKLIPLAVPIIVIIRGTLVDALRNAGARHGQSPFGITSSKWGQRIVASPAMRTVYGISKGIAFCCLAVTHALRLYPGGTPQASLVHSFWVFSSVTAWIATALCIVRAIPVLVEAPGSIRDQT